MSPALNFWTLLRSDGFPSLATASIHFHNCDAAIDYYVIKVDANNFKLVVSLGVSALNFTSDDNADQTFTKNGFIQVQAADSKTALVNARNCVGTIDAASQPLLPSLHELFSPFIVNAL